MTTSTSITASFDPALTDACGVITYWTGASGVRVSQLDEALKARGLDLAPEEPSPEVRVRRAALAACPKGYIVRQSPKGGRSIVREEKADGRLRYTEILRASWTTVDGKGQLATEVFDNDQGTMELAMAVAEEVRARFVEDADVLTSEDLLVWLGQRVVRTCQAVSLRRMGGIYFVPRSIVPLWNSIRDAVHSIENSAQIWEIPAMDGAEAAMAVLDALQAEAAQRVEEIERDVLGGELGRRALDARTSKLEELAEKLESYAAALDLDIGAMLATVERAKASVTVAVLGLAADEQPASQEAA